MKWIFKNIRLMLLFFLLLISSLTSQLTQKRPAPTDRSSIPKSEKIGREIVEPSNWIARGGCWNFSKKIITGQGISVRQIAYFKKENFSNFEFEIRLRFLTDQDGSYGMIFRFDEEKNIGYLFSIFKNGGYEFGRLEDGICHQTGGGQAEYVTDQLKTWNHMKVVCKGEILELYINENLLVTMNDTSFKSGKVGFYLGGGPTAILEYEVLSLKAL